MTAIPRIALVMLLLCALTISCAPTTQKQDTPRPTQVANPAATYCIEQSGEYTIVTAEDGSQSGTCTLADGTVCGDWEYFRGDCP